LGVVHHHQTVGLGKRQRRQEHAVENAEDGRRHADAEGERDHGEHRDEAGARDRPHGDFQIQHQS
jgi:hypothetical protein